MEVRVPQLAEGVEVGTVVSVLVKEGDAVKKNQVLLELETNKAVATIPSPEAGNIGRISVKEGDEVPVGALLMMLSQNGAAAPVVPAAPAVDAPAARSAVTAAAPVSAPVQSSAPSVSAQSGAYHYESKAGVTPPASPTIRKIAADVGIDLTRVKGSESGGRIVLADLKAYLNFLQARAFSAAPESGASAVPAAKAAQPSIDFSKWGPITRKKMTPLRKAISTQMLASWSMTPRVTQFDDVTVDQVMTVRKTLVDEYKKKGASLTITPFILKAVVATLKKHPVFNSSMDEAAGEVVYKDYFNVGIAVDTEQGLIVPVIKNVDQKSILDLSIELADLAQRTRDRKVSAEDLQGATFTISNQGMIGGTHFTPIINKPEVAILGIGRGGPKPVVDGKKIIIQNRMPIALSYDHRVIDGGSAARFVVDFAEALNQFSVADLSLGADKKAAAAKKTADKPAKKKGKK